MNEPDTRALPGMIGEHPSMKEVYALVRRAAPTDLPIVIVGETGTGKELVARAVHELSSYRGGRFVDINCAAIPESLVESELFGWERGAFTGAHRSVRGLLEEADGGTLFLDEACSLPKVVQAKLLRVLELREHRRVGGRHAVAARFRVVLALQRALDELVRAGAYLPAFAHRIEGVAVHLPPLARRGSDIRKLAESFLAEVSGGTLRWGEEALHELSRQPWPGNVRELRALASRIPLQAHSDIITSEELVLALARRSAANLSAASAQAVLIASGGNVSRAARALGVARSTLREKAYVQVGTPTANPTHRDVD